MAAYTTVRYLGQMPVRVPTREGTVIVEPGDVVDVDPDIAEAWIRDGAFETAPVNEGGQTRKAH